MSSIPPEERCEWLKPPPIVSSNLTTPTLHLKNEKVIFSRSDVYRDIKIPSNLTPVLAEDIGIQVGDGSMVFKDRNKTIKYRIDVAGNIFEDKLYFRNVVIPIKRALFNLDLSLLENKVAGVCYIKFESKGIVTFYFNSIGLQWGKKVETYIPDIIFNGPTEIKSAFMRGLADTDFSLSFKKNFKEIHSDPFIQLGCSSKTLIQQSTSIVKSLGMSVTTLLDSNEYDKRTESIYIKNYLFVHGKKNLKKWMDSISFHNPVHLTKYEIWKRFGFCPLRTTLQQRLDILEDKLDINSFIR